MFPERISLVAVAALGLIGLALVALMAFRSADVPQLSVPLTGIVGALAGLVSVSHPRPAQSSVSADTINVETPDQPAEGKAV